MKVAQIWKYPVKSMVGTTVESCTVDELGIQGDRQWAVRDLDNGGIRGAKKLGGLMLLEARQVEHDLVEIICPDGRIVRSDDPNVDEVISSVIGVRVRLESLRPASDLDHFRRGAPSSMDMMEELRSVFGRDPGEPLPDFSVFPPEVIEFESPPGTYYDCWPLMVMSTSALAALSRALPGANVDVRRFRPSLVIDTDAVPGHPEFSWTGRRARVGRCEVEFLAPCPRCVMTTRAVGTQIPEDRSVLRHIVRELDQNLGVYARIVEPGVIDSGDAMEFLS